MKSKRKIMNIAFCIFMLFVLPFLLHAQITFERYFGSSGCMGAGYEVFQKNDDGYAFAGITQFVASPYYFYLVRTDSLGDTLWTRTYGGTEWNACLAMDIANDGGYILAGCTKSFGVDSIDIYVVRTDSFGDTLWTRTYGGFLNDWGYSIKQTSDGGFIITGHTQSFGMGGYDIYLIRIDSLGDTLWTRTYGDSLNDLSRCVEVTPDNNFVIAGWTESFGAGVQIYLIKVDSLGSIIWSKIYGGGGVDRAHSIRNTNDGGLIISGQTSSYGATYYDVYLIKVDSLGDSLWAKLIGHDYGGATEFHAGLSVEQTTDQGYIIAGYAQENEFFQKDLFLIKTNASGDTLWTRLYGYISGASETGYSVKQTSDGGYIIAGHSSGGGHGQAYLVKTDGQGNVAIRETPYRRQITKSYLRCFPNPFSLSTTISFSVPIDYDMNAKLQILDVTGRLVKDFPQQRLGFANGFRVTWDGRNGYGNRVSSGIYFVVLQINDCRFTEKLILVQ